MSVREQMGYALRCDFPGCGVETGDLGAYAFWGSIGDAVEEWRDHDGISDENGTYCAEHTTWSEPDENGDDERVGMQPTLANLFVLAERRIACKIEQSERWALMRHGDRCREVARIAAARERALDRDLVERGILAAVPF